MKRTKGGWLFEPGDPIPLSPERRDKIAKIFADGIVRLIRDGKLKSKDGKIDWSSLPPPPPRKKSKIDDFKVVMFLPDPSPEDEASSRAASPGVPPAVPKRHESIATPAPPTRPSAPHPMRRKNVMTCDACGGSLRLLHADGARWMGICSAPACGTLHRGSLGG